VAYFVYILRTKNNRLYIGQTNNLGSRMLRHKDGKGARFIKDSGAFFDVLYFEDHCTRVEAMRREEQLKRWTRAKKEALISGDIDLLKRL
jgi:predicted GIY-YIG superfamily endonuclease